MTTHTVVTNSTYPRTWHASPPTNFLVVSLLESMRHRFHPFSPPSLFERFSPLSPGTRVPPAHVLSGNCLLRRLVSLSHGTRGGTGPSCQSLPLAFSFPAVVGPGENISVVGPACQGPPTQRRLYGPFETETGETRGIWQPGPTDSWATTMPHRRHHSSCHCSVHRTHGFARFTRAFFLPVVAVAGSEKMWRRRETAAVGAARHVQYVEQSLCSLLRNFESSFGLDVPVFKLCRFESGSSIVIDK